MTMRSLTVLLIPLWGLSATESFMLRRHWDSRGVRRNGQSGRTKGSSRTSLGVAILPDAAASLVAGSLAGAIGVGVAFPFDTLKTKQIVLSQERELEVTASSAPPSNALAIGRGGDAALVASLPTKSSPTSASLNMFQVISHVMRTEGVAGFYGGVRTVMLSQAFVKSLAFAANENCHAWLVANVDLPSSCSLLLAACFAGFVTSFPVAPVERLKVVMQASPVGFYDGERDLLRRIIRAEGMRGFLFRGLGATLAREVPSYGIFFSLYGSLMNTHAASVLGPILAPLTFGALSGMGSRIPVYPCDVVKTLLQNTEGGESDTASASEIVQELFEQGGVGAFFDGVESKVIRAGVNHAVSFLVYDWTLHALTTPDSFHLVT